MPKPKNEKAIFECNHENEQLQWDHSPEQYALLEDIDSENDSDVLQLKPKRLFSEQTDSIESSSHEEVFMRKSPVVPSNPKLKRRNAIRIKKNTTEPRVTRGSLRLNDEERNARSQPNSPTPEDLHRCQNLEARLHHRRPLVANAVNLEQAQDLTHALEDLSATTNRWNLRRRPKVDYLKLHLGED